MLCTLSGELARHELMYWAFVSMFVGEYSRGSYEQEEPAKKEDESKREKESKERALAFLVHTKRAENVEAAEAYLEQINQIKEKLVQLTREQISDKDSWQGVNDPEYPHIRFGYDKADAADLDEIEATKLDRTNPELWKLSRTIENSYQELIIRERSSGRYIWVAGQTERENEGPLSRDTSGFSR